MCVSFSDMGHSKAEREIESHESGKTEIETRLKPFTIKTQAHQIEALDIVSEMMEMSRSALVVKLINHYLGQAVYDFLSSYNSVFSHDKPEEVVVLDHIEGLLATKYPDLSPEAKSFIINSVSKIAFEM